MGRRYISPHEPDQPIAGIEEAIRDSDEMMKVRREKQRRITAALRQLEDAGMTVLRPPGLGPDHSPHEEPAKEQARSEEPLKV